MISDETQFSEYHTGGSGMSGVRVGMFAPVGQFSSSGEQRQAMLTDIADSGVDHVCVGDHVSFHVGAGADGLIDATSMR